MEAHSIPRGGGLAFPRSRRLLVPLGDDRLVEQVRRGNDVAFEVVYDRYSAGILAFCRHMLSSRVEAEDAVQHTFIQAYDSLRRGRQEIKLKAWLYTIARNRCLSILRARREQATQLTELPSAGLSEEVQQRSDLRELLGDIHELPEDQRAALVLSEVGDLSHADIAAVIGCEAAKVKSLVFQARSSLIESRKAREIPCHEIREQLATASGGALRRGPLRRHVKHCQGCAEFRDEVRSQRKMLAAALPVIPTLGLKHSALAAVGIGTGASAAGGGAAGGGLAGALGSGGAAKAVAIVALAGATVGGGVAITHKVAGGGSGGNGPADAAHQHAAVGVPARAHGPGLGRATSAQRRAAAAKHGQKAHGHGGAGAGHRHGSGAKNGGTDGGRRSAGDPANAHHSNPNAQGTPAPNGQAYGYSGDVPQGNANGNGAGGGTNNGGTSGRHLGADRGHEGGGDASGGGSTAPGRSNAPDSNGSAPHTNSGSGGHQGPSGALPSPVVPDAQGRAVGHTH